MASLYPIPILDIQYDGNINYTVVISVNNDTNVYYQPVGYKITITNNTIGGELENIADVDVVGNTYSFVSHGGEDLVISVSAFFEDGTETDGVAEYTTKLIPITSISPINSSIVMTEEDESDDMSLENVQIFPPNASVLFGTRPKVRYQIAPSTANDFIEGSIKVDDDGVIYTMNAKPGYYEVKLLPADEVNMEAHSNRALLRVVKDATGVEINNDMQKINLYLVVPNLERHIYVDNLFVTPTDATNRKMYYELRDVDNNSSPITINSVTGEITIPTGTTADYRNFEVTGYDEQRRFSKSFLLSFFFYNDTSLLENWWNFGYDTCPEIMTSLDFNAILANVRAMLETLGLEYPGNITLATPETSMELVYIDFRSVFLSVKRIVDDGVWNGMRIRNIVSSANIPTSFTYAPTNRQWNIILGKMRIIRDYILSH